MSHVQVVPLRAALAAAACLAALWSGQARGAPPPAPTPPPADAGAIAGGLIDKGQAAESGVRSAPGAPTPPPEAAPHPRTGEAFLVKSVVFPPSRFIRPAEFDRLAAPLIGRKVTLGELQDLVDKVNALYARRGALSARAFLPPQKVAGGVVHIELVEAKLGRLKVETPGYTHRAYVEARIAPRAGEALDVAALQKDIGRFNRNNDAQVEASLSPGVEPGSTDVLLTLHDPPRNSLQLFVDNYGYPSTGRTEGGALFRRNRVLLDGDHASLYVVGSDGSVTGNAAYSVPADLVGGRLGLTYAHSDIHVVNGSASSIGVHGISDTGSLSLAVPIVSEADWTLSGVGVSSVIRAKDTLSARTIDDTVIAKETLGLSASRVFGAIARLSGDLQGSWASVKYDSGAGPGTFWEGNGDFDLVVGPWRRFSLHLNGAAEYVDQKIIPGAQQFQLGGEQSVRGFAPGVATGHAGYDLQSELHVPPFLGKGVDPYAFADMAQVWGAAGGRARADGAGFGFNITPLRRLTLQASYAFALDRLSAAQFGNRMDLKASVSF